VSLDLAEMMG